MRYYRNIILAALGAVVTGYAAVALVIAPWNNDTAASPFVLASCTVGYLLWVIAVLVAQAMAGKQSDPDERETLIDRDSEQLSARLLEAGVFVLIAGVIIGAILDPNGTSRFSTSHADTLVFYLLSIVTIAAIGRFSFILHQEAYG